ncbi:MAG TPA: ADP-ribosylation factor-directed GTPase activating protein isoform b [Pirellulales bacterium]|nr:ADP-ribosylation factor-directed GTPase activating protein isoform b [Pirellulales bacterium]
MDRRNLGWWPVAMAWVAVAVATVGCGGPKGENIGSTTDAAATKVADTPLPTDEQLKKRLDDVIEMSRERRLDPATNNAWQIVHGVLAFGYDLELNVDGKPVPGLQWILDGGKFRGWTFAPGPKGLRAILDPGTKVGEGHEDQWLGYMSQAHVDPETPITIDGTTYKIRDLITESQWDSPERPEATWTVMGLGTYLPTDATWKAKDATDWNLERLVTLEAAQDLNASACGGSHRLYGLSVALNRRKREGLPITGGWLAAQEKIYGSTDSAGKHVDGPIDLARKYQQPDGSFSTEYFRRAASSRDIANRINTTGHTLEFLALALPNEELSAPWVTRACVALLKMLESTRDLEIECAGLYHAVHGLRIYRARRFGESDSGRPVLDDLIVGNP